MVLPTMCWTQFIGGGTAIMGADANRSGGGTCIDIFCPLGGQCSFNGSANCVDSVAASMCSSGFNGPSFGSGDNFSSFTLDTFDSIPSCGGCMGAIPTPPPPAAAATPMPLTAPLIGCASIIFCGGGWNCICDCNGIGAAAFVVV